jgi:sterol desaturase/sphingolipid hydroxylase (fatty acid hydroxylase superfamily)
MMPAAEIGAGVPFIASFVEWLAAVTPDEIKAFYRAAARVYFSPWLWIFLLGLFVLERVRPAVATQPVFSPGLAQDFVWFNFDFILRLTLLPAFVGMLKVIYNWATGGFTIAAALPWPLALKIVLAVLVFDLLQWSIHWVRHKVPLFWHFHAVHHSQRELNVFTDARIHAVDYMVAETIAFMPMLLLGVPPLAVMGVGTSRLWYARFVHANIRMNLGPLKHILVTPQYHRIHHSIERRHHDKNLAPLFTIWDRMAGTMNKDYDEYPATGVVGMEFPPPRGGGLVAWAKDFVALFLYPFRMMRRANSRRFDETGLE